MRWEVVRIPYLVLRIAYRVTSLELRDTQYAIRTLHYGQPRRNHPGTLPNRPAAGQRRLWRGLPRAGPAPGPPGRDQRDGRDPPRAGGAPDREQAVRARGADAGLARPSWPDAGVGLFSARPARVSGHGVCARPDAARHVGQGRRPTA